MRKPSKDRRMGGMVVQEEFERVMIREEEKELFCVPTRAFHTLALSIYCRNKKSWKTSKSQFLKKKRKRKKANTQRIKGKKQINKRRISLHLLPRCCDLAASFENTIGVVVFVRYFKRLAFLCFFW